MQSHDISMQFLYSAYVKSVEIAFVNYKFTFIKEKNKF